MGQIPGFEGLEPGQRVKLKGKFDAEGVFTALEVTIRSHDENASIVGLIQEIDHVNHTIQLLNRKLKVPADIEVTDFLQSDMGFQDLKPQTMVKIKVKYTPPDTLEPQLIKVRETLGFNIDKLKGEIESIDPAQKIIRVLGFPVRLTEKTVIELT